MHTRATCSSPAQPPPGEDLCPLRSKAQRLLIKTGGVEGLRED